MRINFTVDEKHFSIDENPDEKLMTVLRRLGFLSVKCGCNKGNCGSCAVLLGKKCVFSCMIPCGIVNGAHITTLEHFSTQSQYQDIMQGFETAGVSLCGFCNPAKIFAAYEIISELSKPARHRISERLVFLRDCCVERDTLVNGIVYAARIHFDKEYRRKNGKQ